MRLRLILASVLSVVWLIWSGHYTVLLTSLGAASVIAVVGLLHRMRGIGEESVPVGVTFRALLYAPWLLLEIVRSNLQVARIILTPALPIAPRVIRVPASQRTDLGRVLFANSITLTPGTVSMKVSADEITVHALTERSARELLDGRMDRRVRNVEAGSS